MGPGDPETCCLELYLLPGALRRKAEEALSQGDEQTARAYLESRTKAQERLDSIREGSLNLLIGQGH